MNEEEIYHEQVYQEYLKEEEYKKEYEQECSYIEYLEQQLKNKDELLEKIKKMSEEYCSSKFIIQTYRLLHNDEERKILESNKED